MPNPIRLILRPFIAALVIGASPAVLLAQSYTNTVLNDHPMAYWRLQETTGTVAFDIVGGYNGSYTNVELGQPGYNTGANPNELAITVGTAISTNPQSFNSYVGSIPLDFATNGNSVFSVEAWVNAQPGQPAGAGIIGKGVGGGGEEFYLDCGGTSSAFRFFIRNSAGTAYNASGTVVPDGNWHYLVGVCDQLGGNIYLYVDGQLNATTAASGGIKSSPNPGLTIGSRTVNSSSTTYDDQLNGSIAEAAIYSNALSSTQVLAHYYAAGIAPIFVEEPTNFASGDLGGPISIPAQVLGTPPLSYQWTTNGVPMGGQTNATFSLTNIPASLEGSTLLVLIVTNIYGTNTSSDVGLNVAVGAPQIQTDVQPLQLELYTGFPETYSVTAAGTQPLYYQWFQDGAQILGATNSAYTVSTLAGSNSYSVIVSNSFNGGSVAPSSTASLIGVARPSASYPATILQDGPIAFWSLDETNGATTANDYAGGHDGSYNNVQLGVAGFSPLYDTNTAAGFGSLSANNSYMGENDNSASGIPLIDFAEPTGSNANFSVEAWANGPAGQDSSGSGIVSKGATGAEEWELDASAPGGKWRFYIREAGSAGTAAIYAPTGPDGNWHHLVGIVNESAGFMVLYVDTVPVGTISAINGKGIYEGPVPVSVGAQQTSGSYNNQFLGTIDDVAIYDYALSTAQVQAHYNSAPLPPYFTSEPAANIIGYAGENVTLSASALGAAPMTNQWYSNNIAIPGQTAISLTLTNLKSGTNLYTIKVSNAYGSVTNLPGTLIQVPAGSGPPQLLSDLTPLSTSRYANESLTYSVTASGSAPIYYQWWFGATAISGATNSSYSIASLQSTNAGTYFCFLSNSIGTLNSSTGTLAVVAMPTNPYSLTVMRDHPVAYYRLDEASGSHIGFDYVGGNNGFYSNAVLGVAGYHPGFDADTAAIFGTNGGLNSLLGASITNVDFSAPNGGNSSFSVEAWVKGPPAVNQLSGGGIVAKGVGNGNEQFALDAHFGFRFYVRNAGANTLVNAQGGPTLGGSIVGGNWQMDGKWHHVVGICDQVNSNLLLYVDGALIGPNVITNGVVPQGVYNYDAGRASVTGSNGAVAALTGILYPTNTYYNANSVSIGSRNKGTGTSNAGYQLNFNGVVDEVALYNYALTPLQVYSHYVVGQDLPMALAVQQAGGHTVLTWSNYWATAVLQSTTNLSGSWVTVTNASPYTVTSPTAADFYRLKLY